MLTIFDIKSNIDDFLLKNNIEAKTRIINDYQLNVYIRDKNLAYYNKFGKINLQFSGNNNRIVCCKLQNSGLESLKQHIIELNSNKFIE